MSTVLEITAQPPREAWLISRDEPVRRKIWLTPDEEAKIIDSSRYEIVYGEIIERAMANPQHGRLQADISFAIKSYLQTNKIGVVYTETHFQLNDEITRVPDVAFVAFKNFPPTGESIGSKWRIPPDLAIEINSPSDDHEKILDKMHEYFSAGVRQVWTVEPKYHIITIYRSFTQTKIYADGDELVCEDILPDFRLNLTELFTVPQPS